LIDLMLGSLGAGLPAELISFDEASSTFDVYVDAQALPSSAVLHLDRISDQFDFGSVVLDSAYEFSNWGVEIYIVAPNVVSGVPTPDKPMP
jgi:hypothetical protein